MRGWQFGAVFAFGLTVSACAATTPTSKVAVDYNRIFAKARNEVLITNILRASAREPLQFSAMGSVTGGVRNTGSLSLSVPSLIGGATILSPELTVNEGINPTVSIVPLSNKEFTEGIMKPVTLDEINYFINQGWDQELILELVVGGIVCPDGKVVFSRGEQGADYEKFAQMFASAERLPPPSDPKTVRMSANDALALVKAGVGGGRTVEKFEPVMEKGHATQFVDVTIDADPAQELTGLRTGSVCAAHLGGGRNGSAAGPTLVAIAAAKGKDQGKVILRSVEAIVYFLGETQWFRWRDHGCGSASDDWPYYVRKRMVNGVERSEHRTLMRIDRACQGQLAPTNAFVQTHFNDETYYLLRQANAGESDRSLSTLSLLDELIALQTSESSIAAGAPIIAIGTK